MLPFAGSGRLLELFFTATTWKCERYVYFIIGVHDRTLSCSNHMGTILQVYVSDNLSPMSITGQHPQYTA